MPTLGERIAGDEPAAKHLGVAVGKRVDFVGEVVAVYPYDGTYGRHFAIHVKAADGSRCVHFAKGRTTPEVGKRYTIRATVTSHGQNPLLSCAESVISRAVYTPLDPRQPDLLEGS